MNVDAEKILEIVRREIADYDYVEVRSNASGQLLGTAIKPGVIESGLEEMKKCLVAPYWEHVRFNDRQNRLDRPPTFGQSLIVADDGKGYFLGYLPETDDFALIYKHPNGGCATIGIHGDSVGCFLAR